MAKKSAKVEKAENPENVETVVPNLGNPKLLAKLQKLAADNGMSLQEMVNVKLDELRGGLPAEIVTQPAEKPAEKPAETTTRTTMNTPISDLSVIADCAKKIMNSLDFTNNENYAIAQQAIEILKVLKQI